MYSIINTSVLLSMFSQQLTLLILVFYSLCFLTNKRINHISVQSDELISLIRNSFHNSVYLLLILVFYSLCFLTNKRINHISVQSDELISLIRNSFHNSVYLLLILVFYSLCFLTNKRINHISVQSDELISLIRNLNPNKETGSDGISGQMLLLCDNAVVLRLQIIFENILLTSTYPDRWKLANITPIFKKGDKQFIKNYRSISLLPICGKCYGKMIFNKLYILLQTVL